MLSGGVGGSSWVGGLHWCSWWSVLVGLVGLWLACLDGHDWSICPVSGGTCSESWSLGGTAAIGFGGTWLGGTCFSVTLGESLVASGSGGTGGNLSGVLGLEEGLDGSELLLSIGNGGGEGDFVGVVLGVLAESKSLGK